MGIYNFRFAVPLVRPYMTYILKYPDKKYNIRSQNLRSMDLKGKELILVLFFSFRFRILK